MSDPVIVVKNLRKLFPVRQQSLFQREERFVHAVDDVSFDVKRGEVLALVGESGCGKSTLALTLQGLEKPTSGQIQINGQSLPDLNSKGLKQLRRRSAPFVGTVGAELQSTARFQEH